LASGKRKGRKSRSREGMYDTSKCHVKFRKPRILTSRERLFDHNRELGFDHNRNIEARLRGVMFRDRFAVGFRNVGVENIEDVARPEEWPDTGPATEPESLSISRDSDWNQTWGPDKDYTVKWGVAPSRDHDASSKPAARMKPQLSYEHRRGKRNDVRDLIKSSGPSSRKGGGSSLSHRKGSPNGPLQPQYQVLETDSNPIFVPPSSMAGVDEPTPGTSRKADRKDQGRRVSQRDKKRAFAFNEYGLALMESGHYDRAMTYFEKATGTDPAEKVYQTNMDRCRQWMEYKRKGGRG